jgi:uncharacterized protein (UPF0262 family)
MAGARDQLERICAVSLSNELQQKRTKELDYVLRELSRSDFSVRHAAPAGPYTIHLHALGDEMILNVATEAWSSSITHSVKLSPLRKIIDQYKEVSANFIAAITDQRLSRQIETIDEGRTSLHNEGADILNEQLTERFNVNAKTARLMFSMIAMLT